MRTDCVGGAPISQWTSPAPLAEILPRGWHKHSFGSTPLYVPLFSAPNNETAISGLVTVFVENISKNYFINFKQGQ
jgi:hypothetical protein